MTKLGLVLESLLLPAKAALERAAELGAGAVQFDARNELRAEVLGDTARRDLRTRIRGYNLDLAAVRVPLRRGLDDREHQQARIEHVQAAMQLAYDLGGRIVTVPLPKLGDESKAATMRDSILAIGGFGDRIGVRLALEAGLDDAPAVKEYLGTFDCGLGVAFDPANFYCNGHDPLATFTTLSDRIVHFKARDARKGSLSGGPKEVAVGAGDIDWISLTAMTDALDYRGAVVVDREDGPTRPQDAANGLQFLKRFLKPLAIAN